MEEKKKVRHAGQFKPGNSGKPPKAINSEEVYRLAKMHCTMKEIASLIGCSVDTLERRFADIIEKGREDGKSALRAMQWKSAEKGSHNMQVWLGKHFLGQRDKPADEATTIHFNVQINEVPK